MPKRTFKLAEHDDREVTLAWKGIWKNIQVGFDGQHLGTIENQKALKAGQDFELPDGSTLGVKLKTGMQAELQVTRDGKPLPGSGGDPSTKLKIAAGIVYFVGGLTLVLGLVAGLGKVELLVRMGMGYVDAGVGVVFLVLGYFVGKRSTIALGIAFALLIIDMVLTIAMSAGAGSVPTAGLVVRVIFLISMFQGFGAIKALQKRDELNASVKAF